MQHPLQYPLTLNFKIVALAPAYHGNTLLALSVSAREHYQTYFRDWLVPTARVPAPYAYRCGCGGSGECPQCSGAASTARACRNRRLQLVYRRRGAPA